MDYEYGTKYNVAAHGIMLDALIKTLTEKELISTKELNENVEAVKTGETAKEFEILEFLKEVERITTEGKFTPEDEEWIRENGIKVDTEENIEKLVKKIENTVKIKNAVKPE